MKNLDKPILLFDGRCPFCLAQVTRLKSLVGEVISLVSFQDDGVLPQFPGLTYEECMKEIKLVTPEGRVRGGAEALFYALSLNPCLRPLRWLYPLPVVRPIMDAGYRWIAQNRYKIKKHECPSGTCPRHTPQSKIS